MFLSLRSAFDSACNMQALSSYVFIAANVILHAAEKSIQLRHLYELLPPMIPFLTSHHHSLRGFTQVDLSLWHISVNEWIFFLTIAPCSATGLSSFIKISGSIRSKCRRTCNIGKEVFHGSEMLLDR